MSAAGHQNCTAAIAELQTSEIWCNEEVADAV
jgi:hypothetical protein